jgi:hypothetical protein
MNRSYCNVHLATISRVHLFAMITMTNESSCFVDDCSMQATHDRRMSPVFYRTHQYLCNYFDNDRQIQLFVCISCTWDMHQFYYRIVSSVCSSRSNLRISHCKTDMKPLDSNSNSHLSRIDMRQIKIIWNSSYIHCY